MGRAVSGRSRGGGRRVIHSCLRSGSRAALGPARRAAAEAARLGRARRLLPRVNLIRLFARCRPGRRRRRRKKKMPSKKKKYNARFPPARIKKIMQTDEEIGKVAAAVPVIISRALELFLESLLKKACHVTQTRNAKTMTTSHLKQCIELEQQFDFLKDLVASVPDMQGDAEDNLMEGEKVSRRGRKPGAGRKNGGTGKGRDPKQSGTDSEEEDDSEDTESNGDEEVSQIVPPAQPAIHLSTEGSSPSPATGRSLAGDEPTNEPGTVCVHCRCCTAELNPFL
ncbi:dr1-associated corepressor isoform X2 [Rhineura floridana]|uniref:dr1-associated corepressor isoform X2 n=1 Tax=Rhineura floridana TaxID=261503 RepID=UPI002AC82E98|nr:dr1-associated corepressor isoform X2 [Rhineura floridana]